MLFALALRNVIRNLRRLTPMIVVLALSFAALVAGNAVLRESSEALYRVWVRHLSADLSVSAVGDAGFTLFGSDLLLVGEYLVPPTIADFDRVRATVDSLPEVRATAAVVTALARVTIGRVRSDSVLFGVDFARYRALFPDLELVAGRFPEPGERGVLLQEDWGGRSSEELIGRSALLSVAHGITFTLREVPVLGVIRYPVADEMLSRVVLGDPDTARALNGYIHGAATPDELDVDARSLLDTGLDDLFSAPDAAFADEPSDVISADRPDAEPDLLADLDAFFARTRDEALAARATVDGAWNFLLIGLHRRTDAPAVSARLRRAGLTPDAGLQVRDWRATVGGTAQLVWYLQVMFNAGLLFVALGASIIVTNALVLSVLERTAEIGTMRALGAGRGRVALMISLETVLVVAGSAVLGILLGTLAVGLLGAAELAPQNRYLLMLFGGRPIRGTVTATLIAGHLLAGLLLAGSALVYPLKRALGISPVRAMA